MTTIQDSRATRPTDNAGSTNWREFAVVAIRHRPATTSADRRRTRAEIATFAEAQRYVITDLFEVFGRATLSDGTISRLSQVAEQYSANEILLHGTIDEQTKSELTKQTGLPILTVEGPTCVQSQQGEAEAWTGRLGLFLPSGIRFEAARPRGLDVITCDLAPYSVSLTYQERTLATYNRAVLRTWINHPADPLRHDRTTWTATDHAIHLAIDENRPATIPNHSQRLLQAVL
jgi:hypothetical protein